LTFGGYLLDAFTALEPTLPDSAEKSSDGHLLIGGVDMVELAGEFGTPLYVYDAAQLREVCTRYVRAFCGDKEPRGIVVYASKAFPAVAMCKLASECGLGIDVAGAGELYVASMAGTDPEKIFFHGNAKTPQEIAFGLEAGVGRFVVDNMTELLRIEQMIASRAGSDVRTQKILVRITPGIEAHTHEFIKTGHLDSKFGFYMEDGSARAALLHAASSEFLDPVGIHLHIGSQILELEPFAEAARVAIDFADTLRRQDSLVLSEMNFGGGLGATYLPEDRPPSIEEYASCLIDAVRSECEARDFPLPVLVVEPGRSITANAGLTLYTVQNVKTTPSGRTYVAIDGGMSDNLRPMLYGATYGALVANKLGEDHTLAASLAGKHCESGDILVEKAWLAKTTEAGDIIATPATGAYGWAMASNYNGQPRPAVVFVEAGTAEIVVERESLEDLVRSQRKARR
jgi:diaminopimelate decarboxylase